MAGAASEAIDRFYAQQAQQGNGPAVSQVLGAFGLGGGQLDQAANVALGAIPGAAAAGVADPAPLNAALGEAALGALSLPGELVRGGIGATAKAVDAAVPWSDHRLQKLDNQRAFDESMYGGLQITNHPLATTLPKPFAQWVMGQLFDPINLVGAGIPAQALKAGKLARAGLTASELESAALGLGKSPDELLAAFAPQQGRSTKILEALDGLEGGIQDTILGLFKTLPKAAGAIGSKIPLHQEIIGDVSPDLTASVRQSENLTDWATALSKRAYLKQFEGGLTEALAHYKAGGGDFGEIDPSSLPSDLAALFTDQVKAGFGHHVRGLSREREQLEKMFGEVWEARNPGQTFDPTAFAGANELERFTSIADSLGVPHGEINSTVDLLKAVQTQFSDQDWNKFDRIVSAYPSGDILTDNPLDLVLDRVVRDRATMLGIEEPTGLAKAWQTGTALFNEQALQSISYLLTNALGGTAMGALEGVNPFRVGRNLVDNFGTAARGDRVFNSGTKYLASALGLLDEAGNPILPSSVSAEGAGMLNDANPSRLYTGTGLTASQRIGAPALGAGGALLGGASGYVSSPDDATFGETAGNILTGAATGGAAGAAIPTLSKYLLQRFSRGIEDTLRQSAWEVGTRRGVAAHLPDLEAIIQQAYTDGFTPSTTTPGLDIANTPAGQLVNLLRQQGIEPPMLTTSVIGNTPVQVPDWTMIEAMKRHAMSGGTVRNPNGPGAPWLQGLLDAAQPTVTQGVDPQLPLDEMLKAVRELDGMFAPDTLRRVLQDTAGATPESARAAESAWRDLIHGASRQGADLSNTINFDYSQLNNLEEMVRQIVPFSTWAMKSMPFFARHIAENPAILTSALELRRQSSEMRDEQGLTSRVQGSLPMGDDMDQVWSTLLGRPVDTYTNPLRGLVPFSDTFKSIDDLDQIDNPIAKAYKFLTAFGPSAHPAIEFILRSSSLLGADTPTRGLSRTAGPLQGLTSILSINRGRGVNPEAALTEGEGALREALSGQEVTDLADTAAERRIDEIALQKTGKPITSGDPEVAPYLQAKSAKKGPLWDQAVREVFRERGVRSLVGYVSNQLAPSAIVSQEEAGIRQSRAGLLVPQEINTRVRELSQTAPMEKISNEDYRAVQGIIQQLPEDHGIRPEDLQAVLAQPVAANVNWLFSAIYEYQQNKNPEISAYSGTGTPEQRRLQAQLGEYRNLASAIPELQNVPPDQVRAIEQLLEGNTPPGVKGGAATGKLAGQISQRRNQFRAANPDLDGYLNWLAQRNGRGSVDQYIEETAGRR